MTGQATRWLVMPRADAAALLRGQGVREATPKSVAEAAVRRGEGRTREIRGGAR